MGNVIKTYLCVKAILFAVRVNDVNVVWPTLSFVPLSVTAPLLNTVNVGLQEFTVHSIPNVT
jgi:hypothetical protein